LCWDRSPAGSEKDISVGDSAEAAGDKTAGYALAYVAEDYADIILARRGL
jgi:hypothetical protein